MAGDALSGDAIPDIQGAMSSGAGAFVALLDDWLMAECVGQVNSGFALPLMSRLPTELLPTHQRNLTDARTRVGMLLEYAFGMALQGTLSRQSPGHRVSYVVANRYPDLAIRDQRGEPVLRLEVKALELVSEEKSANFDTLLRDVHPDRDVLCVLLWEWQGADLSGRPVIFPQVKRGYAFEAYLIAKVRDLGWLSDRSKAPVKGIDVIGPVVGDASALRAEEHNMGKLMRIVSAAEAACLPRPLADHPTLDAYRRFGSFTITEGVRFVALRLLDDLGVVPEPPPSFVFASDRLQTVARGHVVDRSGTPTRIVIAAGGRQTPAKLSTYAREQHLLETTATVIAVLNDGFYWTIHSYDGTSRKPLGKGKKPDRALRMLRSVLGL